MERERHMARQFKLVFDLDNAAFQGDFRNDSIGDILDHVATLFHDGHIPPVGKDVGPIWDVNGNTIGSWRVK